MVLQSTDFQRSSWAQLQGDYQLRTPVDFEAAKTAGTTPELGIPPIPTPTKNRKILLIIGLVLAAFDLCILPIVLFYSLTLGTNLSDQDVFIVIACLFCMMTFGHYTHRCIRLLFKCSSRYGPIGWKRKWRLLEFTNVNFAICAIVFEAILVGGTWPETPVIRVCAMVTSSICYYTGSLFVATAYMTRNQYRLSFDMSSTLKGALWKPALLAILEDTGAIEARGEIAHREAVIKRYESSAVFRDMLLQLTWVWGYGLLGIAVVTTVLIAALDEKVAFGVGWGLPYAWIAVLGVWTVGFVKKKSEEEKRSFEGGGYMTLRESAIV